MTGTSYTDPSGLDPSTTSTAADQVRLGMAAMRMPATRPRSQLSPRPSSRSASVVRNYNTLLGQDGVAGLKTGSTQAAGGCLLIVAWQPGGQAQHPDRGLHFRPARHGRDHPAERVANRPQPRACPGSRPRLRRAVRFA